MATLLKIEQVAQALQIATSTAYKLVSEGKIKGIKVGKGERGAVRVHPEELERFQREGVQA
jgi:excisionase family DNA binding protein